MSESATIQSNSELTLLSSEIRRTASPISGATVRMRMRSESSAASVGRIVSVITSSLSAEGIDPRYRPARKHPMGDIGRDALRPGVEQRLCGVAQGSARIDDVVDQDAGATLHVADDVHHLALARTLAALVDDRQRGIVEPLGQRAGAHHAADVGRDDHHVAVTVTRLDIGRHHRLGVEVVGRDIEEALDLPRMQVDREHPVGARLGDQIGDQFGRDRGARPAFRSCRA